MKINRDYRIFIARDKEPTPANGGNTLNMYFLKESQKLVRFEDEWVFESIEEVPPPNISIPEGMAGVLFPEIYWEDEPVEVGIMRRAELRGVLLDTIHKYTEDPSAIDPELEDAIIELFEKVCKIKRTKE